jgi:pyruvate/2-oxoglutarate dehydrogenase complex dihydrolipoamide dehydrogenase (E3) component
VGRCDLGRTARGAIAGHGGLLKLIFRADDRKLLGVHCFGDIASEVVGLGQVVLHVGASVEFVPHSGAQHADLQLRLPRRSHRRPDPADRGDGSRRRRQSAETASAGR